ncbi:MAG: DNA polymerase III subunit delta [Patescibacteria group bacterium]
MILLVYGDDAFRVKERSREFVEKFAEKFDPTRMNIDEFVFAKKDDVSLARVAEAIAASPFLSAKRMVRVDGIFSTVTTKPDAEPWAAMLERVPESTILVLVDASSKEKVEKTEVWKRVSVMKDVHSYPLPALSGSELQTWIANRAKTHGAVMVPAVSSALVDRVGNDSWRLETEIGKLSAYAGDAPISEEMIAKLVSSEYREDIFALMDAMSADRASFALKKLHEERVAGADEFPLFGMLMRQIRLLLQVRSLCDESPTVGKQDVANALGLHPFVAQKVLGEARRRSFDRMKQWHGLASDLDFAMKRGLAADVAVDRLVAAMLDDSSILR